MLEICEFSDFVTAGYKIMYVLEKQPQSCIVCHDIWIKIVGSLKHCLENTNLEQIFVYIKQ